MNRPLIIAHRGARAEAPENTAAAFAHAMAYPIDGIELDVQMSADGVALLFHDRTLKKVAGVRRRPGDLSWEKLQEMDAGSWFAPEFAGEPLLGFDRMLEMFAGRTRLFIEIKVFKADRRSGRAVRLTDSVLQALTGPRYSEHLELFRILSFDPEILLYAGGKDPGLQLVLDVSKAGAKGLQQSPKNRFEHLSAFCIHVGGVSPDLIEWAHGIGKEVFVYTCNDKGTLQKMLAARVDGVLTDDPGWLARELTGPGQVRLPDVNG